MNECYNCQYRSKNYPLFCNNYMMPIKLAIVECNIDNKSERILMQTKGRDWLEVDEIKELKELGLYEEYKKTL